jgi:hypothetical protein
MDDQQEALNQGGEETAPIATPAVEEQTGVEPTESQAEPTGEAEAQVEETSKKGANARIRELSAEKKQIATERDTLAQKVEQLEAISRGLDDNQFNAPTIQPGQEITPEQYEATVQQKARAAAFLEIKRHETINNLKQGLKEGILENPELQPGSDVFDPELSDSISEDEENFIKVNPLGDVKKFISKKMKPFRKAQELSAGEASREVAKQSSERATRPTAHQGGEKPFESLSLEEMEQQLGKVY